MALTHNNKLTGACVRVELAVRQHLLANKPRNDDGDDEEGTGRDAGRD